MHAIIEKFRSAIVKKLFSAILLSSFYYIIQFIFTKILSDKISVEEFGEYRYFFSILAFSGIFSLGFVDGFQIEWIARKRTVNYRYIHASCLVTLFVACLAYSFFDNKEVSLLVIINIVVANFVQIINYVFVKNNLFLFYLLQLIFSQSIQILILLFYPGKLTLVEIFYMHTAINIILAIAVYAYCFRKKMIPSATEEEFETKNIFTYIRYGFPVLLSGLILVGFTNIDKLILKHHYSELEYGYYCFASFVALVVYGVLVSLASILFKKIVDTEHMEQLYNNAIYALLATPFIVILFHGVVVKVIGMFFPGYIHAVPYYSGFVNLYFPLLANNLVILNVYKKHNQVMTFALIALVFLILMAAFLVSANSLKLQLANIPYGIAIILCCWFFTNDFILSRSTPALFKRYWQRTAICVLASALVILATFFYR